jgi:hypothetical protein
LNERLSFDLDHARSAITEWRRTSTRRYLTLAAFAEVFAATDFGAAQIKGSARASVAQWPSAPAVLALSAVLNLLYRPRAELV